MSKRLNIFGVVNHVGNQYEMLKLAKRGDVKFHYLLNNVRRWSKYSSRPEPSTWLSKDEFEWVTHYEPGKYDLAILHVDQQHTDPFIGKGQLYRQMNEVIQDIPKLVINHGTPMWDDFYTEDLVINGGEVMTQKGLKKLVGMKDMIGDNFMVVNSYTSVDRWGFGYPLIHGMDPKEWYDLPDKEFWVALSVSPGGLDKYYNRQLITALKTSIPEKSGLEVMHINVNINFEQDNWEQYKRYIGKALFNLSPYKDSPMPRSRTEAMLSGACILTSKYHDADEFIEHGVDGFIVPDNPLSYANAIYHLMNGGYKDAIIMGQRAKMKAQKLFHIDRYLDDLQFLIFEVANKRKPVWDGRKIWDTKNEQK